MKTPSRYNIQTLLEEITKLKKQIKSLRSDLKTFEKAWGETSEFLKDYTGEFSLEDTIAAAKRKQTLEKFSEESESGEEFIDDSIELEDDKDIWRLSGKIEKT